MVVIEKVERLRQLKRKLRDESWLPSFNSRFHGHIKRPGEHHQLPQAVAFRSGKEPSHRFMRNFRLRGASFRPLTANPTDSHHRILAVGTSLSLKAQRILKIKCDGRVTREFQKKKSQRPNGNLVRGLRLRL